MAKPKSRVMKTFANASFFRAFDLLLGTSNPLMKQARWSHDGVEFEVDRHSYSGPRHGLTIEIYTLTRAGRRGWSFMVTKEYWWAGPDRKALKNLHWARPLSGARVDMLNWMRAQEKAFERALPRLGSNDRSSNEPEVAADDFEDVAAVDDDEAGAL
jgi:hypothetical protein